MAIMPLQILGGAAEAFSEEMDAKKQRAADILLAQQKYLMESGIAKIKAIRDARKESQARISKAKTFGFGSKAALALEMSGQLESTLTRLTKIEETDGKDIDRQSVAKMSQAILESVPPEKLAQAMEYAIDAGAAEEVTADKLINAIFSATTPEEIGEVANTIGDISGGEGLPSIGPFGLNLLSLTETDPADDAAARKLLESRVQHLLGGDGGRTDEAGGVIYQYANPTAAGAILDNAFQYYLKEKKEPLRERTLPSIMTEIANNLNQLVMSEVDLNTIANDYDFSNPSDFNINPTTEGIPPGNNDIVPPGSQGNPPEQSDDEILDDNNLSE